MLKSIEQANIRTFVKYLIKKGYPPHPPPPKLNIHFIKAAEINVTRCVYKMDCQLIEGSGFLLYIKVYGDGRGVVAKERHRETQRPC